jgi:hypothetical protein
MYQQRRMGSAMTAYRAPNTVKSTASLPRTIVTSEAWLQRFNVPDDELNEYWVKLHATPKRPVAL